MHKINMLFTIIELCIRHGMMWRYFSFERLNNDGAYLEEFNQKNENFARYSVIKWVFQAI